jgi:hypothetical protein
MKASSWNISDAHLPFHPPVRSLTPQWRPLRGTCDDRGQSPLRRQRTCHGLRAGPFRLLADENPAAFGALLQALLTRHNPADAVERHWVEGLAMALWRQRRADHLEDGILDAGTDEPESARLPSLDTLLRYRARIERDIRQAEAQLDSLRRARPREMTTSGRMAPEQLRLLANHLDAQRAAPPAPTRVERPIPAPVTGLRGTREPEKPALAPSASCLTPQQLRRLAAMAGLDLPMAA